jgi:hypothetical protein
MPSKINSKYKISRVGFFENFFRSKILLVLITIAGFFFFGTLAWNTSFNKPNQEIEQNSQSSKYVISNYKSPIYPETPKTEIKSLASSVESSSNIEKPFFEQPAEKENNESFVEKVSSISSTSITYNEIEKTINQPEIIVEIKNEPIIEPETKFNYKSLPVDLVTNTMNTVLNNNDRYYWEQSEIYRLSQEISNRFYLNGDEFKSQFPEGYFKYENAINTYYERMNQSSQ